MAVLMLLHGRPGSINAKLFYLILCRRRQGAHSSLKASMGSPVSVLASYCSMRNM